VPGELIKADSKTIYLDAADGKSSRGAILQSAEIVTETWRSPAKMMAWWATA
jgi:hypothetical protein